MDGLIVNGLVICVTVQVCVEWEVLIILVVVLVSSDVSNSDGAWEGLQRPDNHMYYIPIGLESAVRKALLVWSGGGNPSNQRVVITA